MGKSDAVITALLLAAVAIAEGIRRVPAETFIVRRLPFGRWVLASGFEIGAGFQLVSWCIPVALPVVLPPEVEAADGHLGLRRLVRRVEAREQRSRFDIALLRIGGVLTLFALVVLAPLAAYMSGTRGLASALALLLLIDLCQAAMTFTALRRVGAPERDALWSSVRLISPFAAVGAAEVVASQVAARAPRVAVLRALLGEEAMVRALRPLAFDVVAHATDDDDGETLAELVGTARLRDFVDAPPAGAEGTPFCPRCGTLYRPGVAECADCGVTIRDVPGQDAIES